MNPAYPVVKNETPRAGAAFTPTRGLGVGNQLDVLRNGNLYPWALDDEARNQGEINLHRHETRFVDYNRSQFGSGG